MDGVSIILVVMGISVVIFSYWSLQLVKKHIRRSASGGITDEKYFELKSRQDYIIATSAIIFGVISLIGYSSITSIKENINTQIAGQVKKIDSLSNKATNTLQTYSTLDIAGNDLHDSLRSALALVDYLNKRVKSIMGKDIIKQNIYIIDGLQMADLPKQSSDVGGYEWKKVIFKSLKTATGENLPAFNETPTINVFSVSMGQLLVNNLTKDGFDIAVWLGMPGTDEEIKMGKTSNLKFNVWISSKENLLKTTQ